MKRKAGVFSHAISSVEFLFGDLEVVGSGHSVTVASGVVRRLDAQGNGHQITVHPSVEVRAVNLSGIGIKVRLPAGAKPQVTKSGIDCDVIIEPGGG